MAGTSLDAARAVLSRVHALEADTADEGIPTPFRDDPEWLLLPPVKRKAALTRYRVLQAYDRRKAPTKADAVAAADELGIQLRSFYFMLRNWRNRDKSIFALVPYRSEDKAPRPSRLEAEVAGRLREQIAVLLKEDPSIAPGKAVRTIESAWPSGLKRPSSVTIRAFIERTKVLNPVEPGSLRLELGSPVGEGAETATRFGEVIVIDHTAPARLVLDETAIAPTITLAIDLFTGVPIGAAVSEHEPSPEAVLDALADAQRRMDTMASEGSIRPCVVLASATGAEWQRLRESLTAGGLDLVERREHRLQFGGSIKQLIGNKLGIIPLQAAKAGRPGADGVELDQDALLTMNQMRFVVDRAIDRLIDERLPEADGHRGVRLQLPEHLAERGSLKSRTRPLIDLRAGGGDRSSGRAGASGLDAVERNGATDEAGDRTFADRLRGIVGEVVGADLVQAHVHEPTAASPGWLVEVEMRDRRRLPDIWLKLARRAIRIAERDGRAVRFEIEASKDADRD